MSTWGTLDAEFHFGVPRDIAYAIEGVPTGSETGPNIGVLDDGARTWVEGRLRDVDDIQSPIVLGWFAKVCIMTHPARATLLWEIDRGPRYRYEWDGHQIIKLRGVLD